MTKGRVGVWNGPKKDDVIYEQPFTPFEDLHHTTRRPASDHPRTCITPSEDLQQMIQMDLHVIQAGELGDKNNNCEVHDK